MTQYRISSMDPLFPGGWGRNVTRNGDPQIGACLIFSECPKPDKPENMVVER